MNRISLHNVFDFEQDGFLPCEPFVFPGGEPHVQLDHKLIEGQSLWLDARIGDPAGWAMMLATVDAVLGCKPKWFGLALPYFPAARQDRRTPGAPYTLRLYTGILSSLGIDSIVAIDPHSDVLQTLLKVNAIKIRHILPPMPKYTGVIAPDRGAVGRANEVAETFGVPVVRADKRRDSATGKLSGFACDPLESGGRYLVVDDVCDGGGTFVGLADAIREPVALDLWVTHGIFSRGTEALLDKFENIYTTDSFPSANLDGISVIPVSQTLGAAMRRSITQ